MNTDADAQWNSECRQGMSFRRSAVLDRCIAFADESVPCALCVHVANEDVDIVRRACVGEGNPRSDASHCGPFERHCSHACCVECISKITVSPGNFR